MISYKLSRGVTHKYNWTDFTDRNFMQEADSLGRKLSLSHTVILSVALNRTTHLAGHYPAPMYSRVGIGVGVPSGKKAACVKPFRIHPTNWTLSGREWVWRSAMPSARAKLRLTLGSSLSLSDLKDSLSQGSTKASHLPSGLGTSCFSLRSPETYLELLQDQSQSDLPSCLVQVE